MEELKIWSRESSDKPINEMAVVLHILNVPIFHFKKLSRHSIFLINKQE